MAFLLGYYSYQEAASHAIRANETKANLFAKLLLEHQRATIAVLRATARQPVFVDSVKKKNFGMALKHLIALTNANPEVEWPYVANPDSRIWVNFPVDMRSHNKDLSGRDWYKGVSARWKPYVSGVYKMLVGEKDVAITVSVPVFNEKGKVIGILNATQRSPLFGKIMEEVGSDSNEKVTLIDQDGDVIYSNRFPYKKEIIKYPSFNFVSRALKGEKDNVQIQDTSDGNRIKYVSFAPIKGIGWSLIVEKERGAVLRSEYSHFALIAAVALLTFGVVSLFLVYLRTRKKQISELEKLNDELDGRVRERTQNLKEEISERKRAEERFRLLSETAATLLITDKPQEVVNELCRNVMAHLDCQTFFNFLTDEGAGRLHLNAYAGIPEEEAKKIEWLDYGIAVCGCAARDGCRIVAEHIPSTPDIRTELVKSYGVKAYACHPLLGPGERVIGTLSFGTKNRETFTAEDLSLMKAVANQVAVAMERMGFIKGLEDRVSQRTAQLQQSEERLKALSSELIIAQETERKRVAHELHDGLAAQLAAVKYKVEQRFKRGESLGSTLTLEETVKDIDTAMTETRRIMANLRPSVLDDLGVLPALSWYLREIGNAYPEISAGYSGNVQESDIPEPLKIVIFRVVQESITNAVRHGNSSLIKIRLDKESNWLRLKVEDNGNGFESVKKSASGGIGLDSMQQRVESTGGIFSITSSPGNGTSVKAEWKIH